MKTEERPRAPAGHPCGPRRFFRPSANSPVAVAGSDGFLLWHAQAHELGARGQAELAEHLAQVVVDRARAEVELCGDLAVGHAGGDESGDLQLLWGQLVERRGVAPPGRLAGGAQLGLGALLPRRQADLVEEVGGPAQMQARFALLPLAPQPLAE